jgi:hypothetical protein
MGLSWERRNEVNMNSLEELEISLNAYQAQVGDSPGHAGINKKEWQFIFICKILIEILRLLKKE